jgi:hypothetical protein
MISLTSKAFSIIAPPAVLAAFAFVLSELAVPTLWAIVAGVVAWAAVMLLAGFMRRR